MTFQLRLEDLELAELQRLQAGVAVAIAAVEADPRVRVDLAFVAGQGWQVLATVGGAG